jgi:ribonuclease P protein component
VLPAGARLRRRSDFAATLRAGRGRTGGSGGSGPNLLVVHLSVGPSDAGGAGESNLPRAGFVVSRAVGGAVVRNRVRRQLRHLVAARLGGFPAGTRLVVRALPAAATASGTDLAHALDAALTARPPRTEQDRRP